MILGSTFCLMAFTIAMLSWHVCDMPPWLAPLKFFWLAQSVIEYKKNDRVYCSVGIFLVSVSIASPIMTTNVHCYRSLLGLYKSMGKLMLKRFYYDSSNAEVYHKHRKNEIFLWSNTKQRFQTTSIRNIRAPTHVPKLENDVLFGHISLGTFKVLMNMSVLG